MTNEKDAAVSTLQNLGYTYQGGMLWKPPLGKAPDFNMLDSLRARAASLEDQLIAQANRAVMAEQQVAALTQRLDMANRLNTDARNQLAQQLPALRAMPAWEPTFDAMVPGQEELVMQFCLEIAGPKGKPGRLPDPVRLLEMAEALYQVEQARAAAEVIKEQP